MEHKKLPPYCKPLFLLSMSLILFLIFVQRVTPPSQTMLTAALLTPLVSHNGSITSSTESRFSNQSLGTSVTNASAMDQSNVPFSNIGSNDLIDSRYRVVNESVAESFLHDNLKSMAADLATGARNASSSTFSEATGNDKTKDVADDLNASNDPIFAEFFRENETLADASIDDTLKTVADDRAKAGRIGFSSDQHCDIFEGQWIFDDLYPIYHPASCPFVDEGFRCKENGRPDSAYMSWRWKPYGCDIPRFNATDMLQRLKGKRLVFAGDSLNRNQFESLLCILREGLSDKTRMVEKHGRQITKGQGSYAFKFLDYSCSVEFYRSHFLVYEGRKSGNKTQKTRQTLRLDKIDKTQSKWRNADVLIFNTGHWWSHTKTAKGRNYFQEGDHIFPTLPVSIAYRKAISTWAAWVDKYVDPTHTHVFFRGYSPAHFRGGQWNSGGMCDKEIEPIVNDSYLSDYPDNMVVLEEVIKQMRTPVIFLNVTKLSDYRKDAHPSIYGHPGTNRKRTQDCSHWCLPGVPDIWNELVYAHLLKPS